MQTVTQGANEEEVSKAREFAFLAHGTQTYGEKPYIYHLAAVAAYVRYHCPDTIDITEAVQVAYLHDILEDTDVTLEMLRDNFSPRVCDSVVHLTKYPDEDYENYLHWIRRCPLSMFVKIWDTYHNMTESLLACDSKRVVKYSEQLKRLVE